MGEIEAVMEGCEGRELGGGNALGLGGWSPTGLSFTVLKSSDDDSCFVIMIQNCFLTDSPYLPVLCLFFFPVFQLQCRRGSARFTDAVVLFRLGEVIC